MGWAPTPGAGAPPIQKGAGQFRGVGRLITLVNMTTSKNIYQTHIIKYQVMVLKKTSSL